MRTISKLQVPASVLNTLRGTSKNDRLLHRLHVVLLVLAGLSPAETSLIYHDSRRAVANWVQRYKAHGIQGLQEESRSGRPSKLTHTQLKRVRAFLTRLPETSIRQKAMRLQEYVKKTFQITLSLRPCERIVQRFSE